MPEDEFPPLLKISRHPPPLWRRILLIGAALLCFVAGIFGWLVPVVTGIPFYVAGLILLAVASPPVRRWVNRSEAKLSPRWRKLIRDAAGKVPIRRVRESIRKAKPSSRLSG